MPEAVPPGTDPKPVSRLVMTAPAKLNLFLHVVGRRDDGYHDLQTVFQLLDFGDRVELRSRADGQIRRHRGPPGVAAEADLAVRAAKLLRSAGNPASGCDIDIEKRIPVGAGLGGGSSDAAAVLVGLNALWRLGLGEEELAQLGLELGADVPVFVRGRSAWAEGVGDVLRPVTLGGMFYLVLMPSCEVSTGTVFADPALTRNSPALTIDRFTCGSGNDREPELDFGALWRATRNDCESVVRKACPPVAAAFAWLENYAEARLTGTGASIFAPFPNGHEAARVLNRLPAGFRGVVARGVDKAPRPGAD